MYTRQRGYFLGSSARAATLLKALSPHTTTPSFQQRLELMLAFHSSKLFRMSHVVTLLGGQPRANQ
jgi:hypothetical protein